MKTSVGLSMSMVAVCFAIGSTVVLTQTPQATGSIPVAISRETTRILEPLKPNGAPDYLAALDAIARQGVTKDNNYAVTALEVFGPRMIREEKARNGILRGLQLNLPLDGNYLTSPPAELYGHDALKGPWKPDQFPAIAAWIEANRGPLDVLVAGAKSKSHIYWPLVSPDDPPRLRSVSEEGSPAGQYLTARVMLRTGAGDVEGARRDLEAVMRIGRLLSERQHFTVSVEDYVHERWAWAGYLAVLARGELTATQARAILSDLNGLPPLRSAAVDYDLALRYASLEWVLLLQNATTAKEIQELLLSRAPPSSVPLVADFNALAKALNGYFDEVATIWRTAPYRESDALLKAASVRWFGEPPTPGATRLAPSLDNPNFWRAYADLSGDEKRNALTPLLMRKLPILGSTDTSSSGYEEETQMRFELLRVAFALAAYRAEKTEYPRTLDDLAPAYLATIPRDVFADKALRYVTRSVDACQACAYVVSSTGREGELVIEGRRPIR